MNVPGGVYTIEGEKSMAASEVMSLASASPGMGQLAFATVQIVGGAGLDVRLQASVDETTWVDIQVTNFADGAEAVSMNAAGVYRANISGLPFLQLNVVAASGAPDIFVAMSA